MLLPQKINIFSFSLGDWRKHQGQQQVCVKEEIHETTPEQKLNA